MCNMITNIFAPELGVIKTDTFSAIYPYINRYILNSGSVQESRNGSVKEILDIKTQITNPYRRCVGGYGRNINIFFLLAEAMWIATGRRDVEFLTLFNKRMSNFSDNGKVFHAPYGWRLRHWGVRSEDEFIKDEVGIAKGVDQVYDAIRILTINPDSRQVVMEIWNPEFDLGFKTNDIPCNDIVMLKIRDGKLITTIGNRSNDLHWGLPTNIFQFSFLTELIAGALGVKLGTQTHNSQSLHIYESNEIAKRMEDNMCSPSNSCGDLYDSLNAKEKHIDFNFSHDTPVNRFKEIEGVMNIIINNLLRIAHGEMPHKREIKLIADFSDYFYAVYRLLRIYLLYKINLKECNGDKVREDSLRHNSIKQIEEIELNYFGKTMLWDVSVLAKNFFAARISNCEYRFLLGKL